MRLRAALHRSLQRSARRTVPLVAALLLAVCGAGTAVALSSKSAGPGSSLAATTDPSVGLQLGVFDRAQTSSDVLPARFAAELQGDFASVKPDVADSREVTADNGQPAYLVPAPDGACAINTSTSFCFSAGELSGADQVGAVEVDLCSPALPVGQLQVEWVLPDGATNVEVGMTNGTPTAFRSGYNVYIARLPFSASSPLPTTLEWDLGGQHHSGGIPLPPDVRSETCAQHANSTGGEPTGAAASPSSPGVVATVTSPDPGSAPGASNRNGSARQ